VTSRTLTVNDVLNLIPTADQTPDGALLDRTLDGLELPVHDGVVTIDALINPALRVTAEAIYYAAEHTGRDVAEVIFDLRTRLHPQD